MSDRTSDPDELDEEPPPLGAPASEARVRERRRRRLRGPSLGIVAVLLVPVALALLPAVAGSFEKTPTDRIGISYGGGPLEGSHFQRIVEPAHALFFNGLLDDLYLYPADERTYIVDKAPGQGDAQAADVIVAPSRDRVQVKVQVAMYFKLNTDLLREFHETLGLRYRAYTDAGWDRLIEDTFRQQLESALQEEIRRYDVADLYSDAELLVQIQDEVQTQFAQRLLAALGQPFFCGPTWEPGGPCPEVNFIVKGIDVPESVVRAFESNRTSAIAVQTRENEIAQREAEARSIEALSAALAVAGDNYVLLRAIESGTIDFWVLPEESGVTLQAPPVTTPDDDQPAPAGNGGGGNGGGGGGGNGG